jgi:hypothetical protein
MLLASSQLLAEDDVFYLNRRVNNAVVSTYKYASPMESLPGITVSAY